MKSRVLTCVTAITLLTVLAIPVRLAAQDNQDHNNDNKHHHYQVIDIGTFGGPSSFFNDLSLSEDVSSQKTIQRAIFSEPRTWEKTVSLQANGSAVVNFVISEK
jgi:hypothetical protein